MTMTADRPPATMREFYCRHCGYFLFEADMDEGRVRAICRSCRRGYVEDLARPPLTHGQARRLRLATRERLRSGGA